MTESVARALSVQEIDVTEAILAGANGYVPKDGPVEEVVAGIRAAAVGQSLISPRIATLLPVHVHDRLPPGAAARTSPAAGSRCSA